MTAADGEEEGTQPENQKAWKSHAITVLDQAKDRVETVKKAVQQLEQRELDAIAKMLEERRRQAAAEAAAAERREREARRRAEEALKRQQAAELKARREEAEAAKRDASDALKAATAAFHSAGQAEADAKEKNEAIKCMQDAKVKVGNAVSKCQLECRMKFGTLMVTEKRLKMREQRPKQELFTDPVHEALEKEWQALVAARESLTRWVKEGEVVKAELDHCQTLLVTAPSRENVARRLLKSASLPSLARAAQEAPGTQECLMKSRELVQKAIAIAEEAHETILRTTEECDRANEHVVACFHQRKAETDDLRKTLDLQRKEAKATMLDAEKRISLLKMRQIRVVESPRSRETTKDHVKRAEGLLDDLKGQKVRLDMNYRLKMHALKIDKSCSTLTKVKAGIQVSKLDPVILTTVQSSPALNATG